MMGRRRDRETLDLFEWKVPAVEPTFKRENIRAASLQAEVAKAIALALKQCGKSRARVADAMSAYLGETVSENMLNAYSSEARGDHNISLARFVALVHATGDYRLLSIAPGRFERAVVALKYLPAMEEAMLAERIERLSRRRDLARKKWRGAR